ncbi:unnamed protein product [Urochloa humidicola]
MIDKVEVSLDFHIFDVLNLDLLLGCPLEKLLDNSQGSLDEKLREAAFTTAVSYLENPVVKPLPKLNLIERMMYISLFVSSDPVLSEVAFFAPEEYKLEETILRCEDERSSSPLTEFELLPPSPHCVVLDHDRESTFSFRDKSLNMENPWAMEDCEVPTLGSKESTMLHAPSMHEDYNHLMVLFYKRFRRLVVDAYVYHKHCKFCGCSMEVTLQLKLHDTSTIGGET